MKLRLFIKKVEQISWDPRSCKESVRVSWEEPILQSWKPPAGAKIGSIDETDARYWVDVPVVREGELK